MPGAHCSTRGLGGPAAAPGLGRAGGPRSSRAAAPSARSRLTTAVCSAEHSHSDGRSIAHPSARHARHRPGRAGRARWSTHRYRAQLARDDRPWRVGRQGHRLLGGAGPGDHRRLACRTAASCRRHLGSSRYRSGQRRQSGADCVPIVSRDPLPRSQRSPGAAVGSEFAVRSRVACPRALPHPECAQPGRHARRCAGRSQPPLRPYLRASRRSEGLCPFAERANRVKTCSSTRVANAAPSSDGRRSALRHPRGPTHASLGAYP